MNVGKKITLFLKSGLPKGSREVKIDQWNGRAICAPRNALNEILSVPELENGACIYFLVGDSEDGGLINLYVGEADGFKSRIKDHDYKKDWWEDVVIFTSQDKSLTKTGIQYLESICVERLRKIGKCNLKNANNPTIPTVPEEDISGLETFYENISLLMPILGYDVFVQKDTVLSKDNNYPLFICKKGSRVMASANLLEDGKMKVLKNSTAEIEETNSFQSHPYKRLKDELVQMGRLAKHEDNLIFVDDYVFDSSSAAAAIVQGRSASGPIEWKTKDNVVLKDFLNSKIK